VTALAARFFNQGEAFNDDPSISSLAHIVNGQRSNCCAGERFHLDTGLRVARCRTADANAIVTPHFAANIDMCERQGMAERNELRRVLGRENPGNFGQSQAHRPSSLPAT